MDSCENIGIKNINYESLSYSHNDILEISNINDYVTDLISNLYSVNDFMHVNNCKNADDDSCGNRKTFIDELQVFNTVDYINRSLFSIGTPVEELTYKQLFILCCAIYLSPIACLSYTGDDKAVEDKMVDVSVDFIWHHVRVHGFSKKLFETLEEIIESNVIVTYKNDVNDYNVYIENLCTYAYDDIPFEMSLNIFFPNVDIIFDDTKISEFKWFVEQLSVIDNKF